MALYRFDGDKIATIPRTTFAAKNIQERTHLQALLKSKPEVISPDTLIIAEEFSDWEDSRRRIDLLGIDKNANLVVIELKRTEDGGHMELQAIRYAAMISSMTFDILVSRYAQYIKEDEGGARERLVEFLNWGDSDDRTLGQNIRIVLASAEFSKELTTSVLWLNDQGLDIRCVRILPYDHDGQVLLDVRTIIPTPEAEEYQIKIREKRRSERLAKESNKDYSKYDVTIKGKRHQRLNKRKMVFEIVSAAFKYGESPQDIEAALPKSKLVTIDGDRDAKYVERWFDDRDSGGIVARKDRFFHKDGDFFPLDNATYVLSNQWGVDTLPTVDELARRFPKLEITYEKVSTPGG